MAIDPSKWEWFGHAGHFILRSRCQFNLCTKVGKYLISSVGDMRGPNSTMEDAKPIGGGPELYETYVFKLGRWSRCECGCGLPRPYSGHPIDSTRTMTAKQANAKHIEFCRKYAAL